MEIERLKRTCVACPSQWEGTDEHGHDIYILYRHGYLSVHRSFYPGGDATNGIEIFGMHSGDPWGGYLSDWGLKSILASVGISVGEFIDDDEEVEDY